MPRTLLLSLFVGAIATLPFPATAQDSLRLHTSRPTGAQLLKLPKEEDTFGFVVFGDRTGGPAEGIRVLAQAVTDTNLLDPDLVFTVGDLVNGYNRKDEWMAQAAEFKAEMQKLRMPWYPVAGNHDIYWRGAGKPAGEHEQDFEAEFGPLWYAVQHKQCWFLSLYSDEGNPVTGKKDFSDPDCQRMSDAQFEWLTATLQKAKGARHIFVFLHHPRWLARYGTDWQRVHAALAANGNVTAVFAGHIHRMRFDGVRDGIQYFTVASVGAHLEFESPQAGYLHEFHVITVRPQGITVAALPVGTVIDPKQITGQLSEDVERVHDALQPKLLTCVAAGQGPPISTDGAVDAVITLQCRNPASRAIELELRPAADEDWLFSPDHQHLVVPPGQAGATTFAVRRRSRPGLPFALPQVEVRCDYLAVDRRVSLPMRTFGLELPPPADLGRGPAGAEGVLVLDGEAACLALPNPQLELPQGPFTVEAWLHGDDFTGRRAVVAKTESSEFALFCSDGIANFSVFAGAAYAVAKTDGPVLKPGQWHHLAGVYDGTTVRCFVDGKLVAEQPAVGERKTNTLPLFVGADPNGSGTPGSFFAGKLDEVRISKVARYTSDFVPALRHADDDDTQLLLHLDSDFGPWTPDASSQRSHPQRRGTAHCTVESRPAVR